MLSHYVVCTRAYSDSRTYARARIGLSYTGYHRPEGRPFS